MQLNQSKSKVDEIVKRAKNEGDLPINGTSNIEEFISQLSTPRKIIILTMEGQSMDESIQKLSKEMESGDVIVGTSTVGFPSYLRHAESLKSEGIHFMVMGLSRDEEVARNGLCFIADGSQEAFNLMEPILVKCAAQANGWPCVYFGPIGSGKCITMVHNGIKYADMQIIAEAYDILKNVVEMSNEDMSKKFASWNKGDLSSYLMEITSKILNEADDITGGEEYLLNKILDQNALSDAGRWIMHEAVEQIIAAPTIARALDVRHLVAKKEERIRVSKMAEIPHSISYCPKKQLVEDLENCLYSCRLSIYAQGMSIIKSVSDANGWEINLAECARIFKSGCIIRSKILDKIQDAFNSDPSLPNLLLDPTLADELKWKQYAWRRIITLSVAYGVACPAFCASLTYYDTYRRKSLPVNLIRAQQDFLSGYSYERTDVEGSFHCQWTDKRMRGDNNI